MSSFDNIYNIPSSCPFWETLAEIYLNKFQHKKMCLADVLFLLPNRRACQALTNAFIKIQGLEPTILPQILPITEMEDDEIFFSSFDLESIWNEIGAPISKEDRLFLFTRLIMSKPNEFGIPKLTPAQALSLALNLATLIDTAHNLNLSFDKLYDLVPEKYASHWQEILKLLKIITEYWPQILKERNAIDASKFKNTLLLKQAEIWKNNKTDKHIVIAGVTASFPSIVKVINTVALLDNGKIFFSGIDTYCDDKYWDAIDENHPQFEIKDLLYKLNIKRNDIKDVTNAKNINREKLISEIMRPAEVSDEWLGIGNKFDKDKALLGIEIINTNSQRDEALAIAIKMREVLDIPQKTAVLVTSDRNLARRVASELKRFDIDIDDSAGIPLNLTPIGVYLRLIVEASLDINKQIPLIDLLKNPLTLLGHSPLEFRKKVYKLELLLRKNRKESEEHDDVLSILDNLNNHLSTLHSLLSSDDVMFDDILKIHIEIAEKLATSDEVEGKNFLWRGEAGKVAVNFITKMLQASHNLGRISGKDYLFLLCELMGIETVRTNYGTHPRLSILGPIEALLQSFDYVIIGELNEGIWPKLPKADMWMSRPMMIDFGFATPEKNIGILGSAFCHFMMADNVILTRADRIDGSPIQKSRWLLRLETVLKALEVGVTEIINSDIYYLANNLDTPIKFTPIKAPAPCPPLNARPRRLSASGIDLLIDDPYSVFAKHILNLYPLDNLDRKLDQRDYGTLIHAIIEEFNNLYSSKLPCNALDILIDLGYKHFNKYNISKDIESFWFPKFINTAKWIIDKENNYRLSVNKVYNEVKGEIIYNLPGGDFSFTAKADRIDVLKNGNINILDYKTGNIPTKKQVENGHAMQLLIEGIIARKSAFSLIKNNTVSNLIYWQLGKEKLEISNNIDELLDKAEEYLLKLINTFDFETTPYHSRPTPKFIPKNKDYEHLARIREWSVQEDGESSDE